MGPRCLAGIILLQVFSGWKFAACSRAGIVGGKEVKPHSSPWMVSLQCSWGHFCGGVLIKEQWVLTTAHWQSQLQDCSEVEAVLGAHSLTNDRDVQRIGAQACIPHQNFNRKTKVDDIMLIKLKTKVKVKGKKIKVKGIPKSGKDMHVGTHCQVTGWGTTTEKGTKPSDTLRGVEVEIKDRELCNCYYNNTLIINADMLCAGNKKGNADFCYGDSGGPLLCKKVLVGVVSGGGCGNPKKPGVYTCPGLKKSSSIGSTPALSWINNESLIHFFRCDLYKNPSK